MGLRRTVEPTVEPVTLADAKVWLKIEASETTDDTLITELVKEARDYIEHFTSRALLEQTWELTFDKFPSCKREIELPRPRLISVTDVVYIDTDEVSQTFAASKYFVDTKSEPGRIVLDDDDSWPGTDPRPEAVTITYKAGYGTVVGDLPRNIITLTNFLISHYYENREPYPNFKLEQLPDGLKSLLWKFRMRGF